MPRPESERLGAPQSKRAAPSAERVRSRRPCRGGPRLSGHRRGALTPARGAAALAAVRAADGVGGDEAGVRVPGADGDPLHPREVLRRRWPTWCGTRSRPPTRGPTCSSAAGRLMDDWADYLGGRTRDRKVVPVMKRADRLTVAGGGAAGVDVGGEARKVCAGQAGVVRAVEPSNAPTDPEEFAPVSCPHLARNRSVVNHQDHDRDRDTGDDQPPDQTRFALCLVLASSRSMSERRPPRV